MLQVNNPYANLNIPAHGGRDRHLALNVNNLQQIQTTLEKKNIPYTASESGRKAVFFRDPDNNVLELIES
jgi:glyoxylase I family protein